MPLSTSNFRASHGRWVAQLLVAFVVFMSLANWGVHYLRSSAWWATGDIQIPGMQNEVIAERYAYDWHGKNIVIVGSSVATQLPPGRVRPPNVATLFLQGCGAMSGLEVLVCSGAIPELVLIEVDFLNRGIQQSLISTIFASPLCWFKRYLPCLRCENNLPNLLFKSRMNPPHINDSPDEMPETWNAKLQPKIDHYLNDFVRCSLPRDDIMDALIMTLKDRVCQLEQRGCKIAFFIDPINPRLAALPAFKIFHERVRHEFPMYPIIEATSDQFYYLTDGIHFFAQSGKEFFDYLMQESAKLLISNMPENLSEASSHLLQNF